MNKQEKIANFNPSSVGINNGNIFGFPFNFEESDIIILPVPWEVTTSFGSGTSLAPQKILDASTQLDFYHHDFPKAWQQGIYMLDISDEIMQLNQRYKSKAREIILLQEKGKSQADLAEEIKEINEVSRQLNQWVVEQTQILISRGKKVILLGGDHSTPLGYLQALFQEHDDFGILQIDAHADLRDSYEGFDYSHASIMHNVLKLKEIKSLTQVGVRDICQEEIDVINDNKNIHTFFDAVLKRAEYKGETWQMQIDKIIATLPQKVYVSFDIDGLSPDLCPTTGTPVPSGLQYAQAIELIRQVKLSGREIIGCDLVEVGNADWDANVGARVLYQLCCFL
ncbi:MAG: agmatinase family protein [Chitinophagales bacterium]